MKLFSDRRAAGRVLADRLMDFAGRTDVIVLALPRGGVPVAHEVARALHAHLDLLTVRKLGAPWNEELAIGAIASGGHIYVDDDFVAELGIPRAELDQAIEREQSELERRDRLYRADRPFPLLAGLQVILVDDGLATGATMRAAVLAVRDARPAAIIVAVPVAPFEACVTLSQVADGVVAAATPEPFYSVGLWYGDFTETSDSEVLALLERAMVAPLPSNDAA